MQNVNKDEDYTQSIKKWREKEESNICMKVKTDHIRTIKIISYYILIFSSYFSHVYFLLTYHRQMMHFV